MKNPLAQIDLKTLKPADVPKLLLKFFTSYGLAAAVLFCLTLITLFGTLNQTYEGLFDTQRKYFESLWVADMVGNFPVFLPGGALLLSILFLNLLLGLILKIRKNWKTVGLYMAHTGILMLIFSAFVTKQFSREGNMALYPQMSSSEALSYMHWQLEVIPVDDKGEASEALVIPHRDLRDLDWEKKRTFVSDKLPFDVVVKRLARNSRPLPINAPMAQKADGEVIDGVVLLRQDLAKEAEANATGAYVDFVPKKGGKPVESILWAHMGANFMPTVPFSFEVDGRKFAAQIVRERLAIPFSIRLDAFHFEKYAGISTAKNYQSDVTMTENGQEEKIEIKMNEPLRHRGYTFFQASFGPTDAQPGEPLYTSLAVVKNPSDHWPLISLIIVGLGLIVHLVLKLIPVLQRRTSPSKSAPPIPVSAKKVPS